MNLIIVVNSDEGGEQFFSTNITRRVTVGTNLVMNEEWTGLLLRQTEHIVNYLCKVDINCRYFFFYEVCLRVLYFVNTFVQLTHIFL